MVHPTCPPFRPRSASPPRTWYAHCSCRSQYIVRSRPSNSTADSRAKISSDVRRASTSKTKGRKRKKRATHLKSMFFVQTPLTIPLTSIKNVARPTRQTGDGEEKVDFIHQYNITQSKNRPHDHNPDPDQPRRQAQQPDPTNRRKTQNTAQTLDSPGTRPMNALSTL